MNFVGGRVVRALFVVVVEAVELRDDEPTRQRRGEENDVERREATADHRFREDEGECQPGEVRGCERTANDPPAPPRPGRGSLLEKLGDRESLSLVEDERRRCNGGSVSVHVRTPLR